MRSYLLNAGIPNGMPEPVLAIPPR